MLGLPLALVLDPRFRDTKTGMRFIPVFVFFY